MKERAGSSNICAGVNHEATRSLTVILLKGTDMIFIELKIRYFSQLYLPELRPLSVKRAFTLQTAFKSRSLTLLPEKRSRILVKTANVSIVSR
eukprot:1136182-Pelagomonas_calceolata.AAC.1